MFGHHGENLTQSVPSSGQYSGSYSNNNRAGGVGTEFLLGGIAVVGMAAIGKTIYDNWGGENKNDKRSKKVTSQNDECSLQ